MRLMIQFLLRVGKRLVVLLPGIVIAYISVTRIYPYFDKRLPLGIAILVTYALGAYLLVPAIIRLFRIIRPADHLPLYCVTPDGFASDPLNIGIVATRRELILAMEKTGWYMADRHSLRNTLRQGLSTVYGWSYPKAPVSSLYLFGRKQDIAFEIPIEGKPGERHHVRFWATTFENKKPLDVRAIQWQHRQDHVKQDNLLWVGAASLDVGIGLIRHNLQITHTINPDTNEERRLIVQRLTKAKLVKRIETLTLGEPYRLINRVMSGSLHTDGKMDIVSLVKTRRG
jgi:hypothetical protein